MNQKYLTFDCYGTLVDWKTGIEKALGKAFGPLPVMGKDLLDLYVQAEKGEEADFKSYHEVLSRTALKLSQDMGLELSSERAEEFASSVPSWPAFEDSSRFLADMKKKGRSCYILSNVDTGMLEETIRNHGFEVEGFVTAEEVRSYKPARTHWLRFQERTGAKREEVLHVAQSVYHDIVPANTMGFETVWVNRYREALPAGATPDVVVENLTELASLID